MTSESCGLAGKNNNNLLFCEHSLHVTDTCKYVTCYMY